VGIPIFKPQRGELAGPGAGRLWASMALVAGLGVWLWPIGIGGRMPAGGDVTQFAIGLMAVLGRAYRAGHLPLWNDLWGYGFPGVAESQMGVFYPPHWLLYGLLPTEAAYTWSLVLHTCWAGLGAAWAARTFGVSAPGSVLSGFAWSTSGFFLIHLPHQWGYTAGSWMPWAWGLGWLLVERRGGWPVPWLLAGVLVLQMLPGHFQLAFCTQVGLVGMAICALVDPSAPLRARVGPALALLLALAVAFPLAAMQLWPTYRLAQLAQPHDFEYLSGFAATPIHLVSYVAPGLFHWSPLWRPVAWDPFHTSPEEHLAYVGLVPLFLAFGAVGFGFRGDRGVRLLTILAVGSVLLSLGPYMLGFELLTQLPGFSFFRAPARWSLATGLALCLLAGKGFDALALWPRPGRSLLRFAGVAVLWTACVVGAFELALASTRGQGMPAVTAVFDRALHMLPWPSERPMQQMMGRARDVQATVRVMAGLERERFPTAPGTRHRLEQERLGIYAHELGPSGLILVGLIVLAAFAKRRLLFRSGLLALAALDLWTLGRHRAVELAPIRPLTEQSRVLARLAQEPYGSRTIDPLRNLPMVAGVAPLSAYRTLDLPALSWLTALAQGPIVGQGSDRTVRAALRASGARVRIFNPFEGTTAVTTGTREAIADPELAGWLSGSDWVRSARGKSLTTFLLWWPEWPSGRAWLVTEQAFVPPHAQAGEPSSVLRVLERAEPLVESSSRPEERTVSVRAERPGVVILAQLFYPEWRAWWEGPGGTMPATIERAFDGWQAVRMPGPGSWTLHLDYVGHDVWQGLAVSGVAGGLAALAFLLRWWIHARSWAGLPPEGERR
jgi:hypothetical protein